MQVGERGEEVRVATLGTELAPERGQDVGRGGHGFGGGWAAGRAGGRPLAPQLGIEGLWPSSLHFLCETESGVLHPNPPHPIPLLAISAHSSTFIVTGGSHWARTCLPRPAFVSPELTGAPTEHPAMSGVSGVSIMVSMQR